VYAFATFVVRLECTFHFQVLFSRSIRRIFADQNRSRENDSDRLACWSPHLQVCERRAKVREEGQKT
jgi:hypothetical protein